MMTLLNLLLMGLIKPLLLIGFGWWQFRANPLAAASSRHLLLLITFAILPLLSLLSTDLLTIFPALFLQVSLGPQFDHWLALPATQLLQLPGMQWLLGIYLMGLLWTLFYLLLGIASLWQREKQSFPQTRLQQITDDLCQTVKLTKKVTLRVSDSIESPQVWGAFNPTIFLPATMPHWPKEKLQLVLLHELGHVARHDWLSRMLVRMISALYWFIPPVWWLAHTLEDMCERACDDWVLTEKQRGTEYAQLLLTLTQSLKRSDDLPAEAITGGSAHYQRILALLDNYLDRDNVDGKEFIRTIIICSLCLLPLSMLQASIHNADLYPHRGKPLTVSIDSLYQTQTRKAANEDKHRETLPVHQLPPIAILPIAIAPSGQRRPDEELIVIEPRPVLTIAPLDNQAPSIEIDFQQQHLQPQHLELAQEVAIEGYLPIRTVTPRYPEKAVRRGIEDKKLS